MSERPPPRFNLTFCEGAKEGDLWRVVSVAPSDSARGLESVTWERVQAEPGTFRRRGDGLWPPLPDTRPVSDEEAREIADRMDAALDAGGEFIRTQAPFLPPERVDAGLQQALNSGWAKPVTSPFADLDCEPQLAAAQERQERRDRMAEMYAGKPLPGETEP